MATTIRIDALREKLAERAKDMYGGAMLIERLVHEMRNELMQLASEYALELEQFYKVMENETHVTITLRIPKV